MSIRSTFSYILFPFTMWYAIGVGVRNMLFSLGILKQNTPHITTIGIGNLSTGGSGKTPHVQYLLDMFADRYHTATLSRGYKRRSSGFVLDDGTHDEGLLGDEASMIARRYPNVQVAVCENRSEGIRQLLAQPTAPQLVILDDAFQHRRLKPSVNILLTEYNHPFYKDKILPYGNLREGSSARHRAGIIIITKCPEHLNPVERHNILQDLKVQNYQKVFFSYLTYRPLEDIDGTVMNIDLNDVDSIVAVTGIAHPEPMLEYLRGFSKVRHLQYADHHEYSKKDIAHIYDVFNAMEGENKIIVTTEKDAVRLRQYDIDLPLYILPIKVTFHKDSNQTFDSAVQTMVHENISFLDKLSIWQ